MTKDQWLANRIELFRRIDWIREILRETQSFTDLDLIRRNLQTAEHALLKLKEKA